MKSTYSPGGGFLHAGPATFFGRPFQPEPAPEVDIALTGIPWDEGNGGRNGANYGPRAVRDVSAWFFSYDTTSRRDVWEALPGVDAGDVACIPGDSVTTAMNIAGRLKELREAGVVPIVVGGNHAVTIGSVQGVAETVKGPMGYLCLDTHLDTAEDWGGSLLASGCPTFRASQLPNVDPRNVVVYGVHGWLNAKEHLETAERLGIRWYSSPEIRSRGLEATFQEAIELASAGTEGLYISVDMDCVDSASAPGVGTPEADGFTGREIVKLARMIGRANPICLDVVEIAPVYDPSGITPRLVCTIILEAIGGMADARARVAVGSASGQQA